MIMDIFFHKEIEDFFTYESVSSGFNIFERKNRKGKNK